MQLVGLCYCRPVLCPIIVGRLQNNKIHIHKIIHRERNSQLRIVRRSGRDETYSIVTRIVCVSGWQATGYGDRNEKIYTNKKIIYIYMHTHTYNKILIKT